ncbi:MAG: DAK2 domain-containing protein, partial [Aggregatilineales bacterium]
AEGVLCDLLARAGAEQYEVITLYYGGSVTAAEAESAAESVRLRYPEQEVILLHGGQPYYHYILSVE